MLKVFCDKCADELEMSDSKLEYEVAKDRSVLHSRFILQYRKGMNSDSETHTLDLCEACYKSSIEYLGHRLEK